MSLNEKQTIVALLMLQGIGRQRAIDIRAAMESHPDSAQGFSANARVATEKHNEQAEQNECLKKINLKKITDEDLCQAWSQSNELLSRLTEEGTKTVTYLCDEFPKRLKNIDKHPAVLFVKGDVNCLYRNSVAIIGTRNPSDWSSRACHRIAKRCAEEWGFPVVSGLALGCDTQAHIGCMEGKQPTVAFLGHGLDHVYPAKNKQLANQIIEDGGALVSEYMPHESPRAGFFAERDRLQSGCSDGLILIESDADGGSMHTVRFANQQNKPIAALVNGEADQGTQRAAGNEIALTEFDAMPLESREDLVHFIGSLSEQK